MLIDLLLLSRLTTKLIKTSRYFCIRIGNNLKKKFINTYFLYFYIFLYIIMYYKLVIKLLDYFISLYIAKMLYY